MPFNKVSKKRAFLILVIITIGIFMSFNYTMTGSSQKVPTFDYSGNISVENNTTEFTGMVHGIGHGIPYKYQNLSFCMYDSSGSSYEIYTIEDDNGYDSSPNVHFEVHGNPKYIIIRSESQWEGQKRIGRGDYFIRDSTVTPTKHRNIKGYREEFVRNPTEYPVDRIGEVC